MDYVHTSPSNSEGSTVECPFKKIHHWAPGRFSVFIMSGGMDLFFWKKRSQLFFPLLPHCNFGQFGDAEQFSVFNVVEVCPRLIVLLSRNSH